MKWYPEVRAAVKRCMPFLLPTPGANLARLVRAILIQRTLGQTELARTSPRPRERPVPEPQHELRHRMQRLSRFLAHEQGDPQAVPVALRPYPRARLGPLRRVGLWVDRTSFNAPTFRVQILKLGIARGGRVIPRFPVAYDRGNLPADKSQNLIEEEALTAVLAALPKLCRPIILADRAFARSEFFQWLIARQIDFGIRSHKGTGVTDPLGKRSKLGVDRTISRGEQVWLGRVRWALYHDRPRNIWLNVGGYWLKSQSQAIRKAPTEPDEPWYRATSLSRSSLARAWSKRRFWIEESFREEKSRLLLDEVRIESTLRLNRLWMALTIAVCWRCRIADPKTGVVPPNGNASVVTWGKAGLVLQALVYIDDCTILPQILEAT